MRSGNHCLFGIAELENQMTSNTISDRMKDTMTKQNIILIGMPGSGKSTVGVVLAKNLGYRFIDSDILIQNQYGKLLHEIIEDRGVEGFWNIENDVNASIQETQCVIATGGSAVYGGEAMAHLQEIGTVVYLQLSYESVQERLGDLNKRGVTLKQGQTLRVLYEERIPLYEQYAHIILNCEKKEIRDIVEEIAYNVREYDE